MDGLDRWITDGNRHKCSRCGGVWWDVDGPVCPDCTCYMCGAMPDEEYDGQLYCSDCFKEKLTG